MPPKNQKTMRSVSGAAHTPPPSKGDKPGRKRLKATPVAEKPPKMRKQEERELWRQEADIMLMIPDIEADDYSDTLSYLEDDPPRKAPPVDAMGNTISKAAQAKAAGDARIETMRAEARARRQARDERLLTEAQASSVFVSIHEEVFTKVKGMLSVEELRQKLADGAKLSRKESKYLQRADTEEAKKTAVALEEADGLAAFSLSYQNESGEGEDCTVSAVDIVVSGLCISAPSKRLLVDASLRICQGSRYGLLGPNGKGKLNISDEIPFFTHSLNRKNDSAEIFGSPTSSNPEWY